MSKQVAVILHNRLSATPAPDEADVLAQVELVDEALGELGYKCIVRDIGPDLYGDILKIKNLSPVFVFNLVETVFEKSELLSVVPSILGAMELSYTGVSDEGLFLTTRKTLAKKIMKERGILTPEWFSSVDTEFKLDPSRKFIFKPVSEEGSVCLDEDAVFRGSDAGRLFGKPGMDLRNYFVEEFIEGREFNLSVTGKPGNYTVYPVAEMLFNNFPEGKERILGYRAKWNEDSFEYKNTCREFGTLENDPELQQKLIATACRCGDVFSLSGYFRIDFRVDGNGQPYVLEINGNPCISPDSGFIAATEKAGLNRTEVIRRIIAYLN